MKLQIYPSKLYYSFNYNTETDWILTLFKYKNDENDDLNSVLAEKTLKKTLKNVEKSDFPPKLWLWKFNFLHEQLFPRWANIPMSFTDEARHEKTSRANRKRLCH